MAETSVAVGDNDLITALRAASRNLAREWGFLRPTIAGSDLSPAAVHALVELGDGRLLGIDELAAELRVSRPQLKEVAIPELVTKGLITAQNDEELYGLTDKGKDSLAKINAFAQEQVGKALQDVGGVRAGDVTSAFRIWTSALERARQIGENVPSPAVTPGWESSPFKPPLLPAEERTVEIVPGYLPGLLGRTVEMHMEFYFPLYKWGREFEMVFAEGLLDLLKRVGNGKNQVWSAVLKRPGQKDRIIGTVYIDGEITGREGVAKLRAFIVDEEARGLGAGRKLLQAAMEFVKGEGFEKCELTTSKDLVVARRMYEAVGFREQREFWGGGWIKGVCSMEYLWERMGVGEDESSMDKKGL